MQRLLSGVSHIVSQILKPGEKTLSKAQEFFNKFKISFGMKLFNIELVRDVGEIDAVDHIYQALTALAHLTKKEGKKAIIFIDEFQDITAAKNAKAIQEAIRHVAQESNELVFLFSGSHRHLLLEMFDDKSMPLYMLCDKLYLERIHSSDYKKHLNRLALRKWGETLPDRVFLRIMALTECHPFYVNLLCHKLWQSKTLDEHHVDITWEQCMEEESRRIRAELEKLTRNQQDFLKALALYPTTEPTGQEFSMRSKLPVSSLYQTVHSLLAKDVIFKVIREDENIILLQKGQIRVLDPLMASYLKQYAI